MYIVCMGLKSVKDDLCENEQCSTDTWFLLNVYITISLYLHVLTHPYIHITWLINGTGTIDS